MKIWLTALISALITVSSVASDIPGLDSLLNDEVVEGAFVGIAIKDAAADSMVYAYNADLRFTTASNLKLFTSAAAIEILDPAYKFATQFYINGQITNKGVLEGDLIIAGGGDPLISGRFRKSLTEVLELWADSILAKGITKIDGNLAIDNSFFENDVLGPGWSHDDLTYWYACPISALSFNDNCVDLHVYPSDQIGNPCRIVLSPETDYIDTINNTTTLPAGSENTFDFYRYTGTNKVEYFGGVALDDDNGVVDYVTVDSPHIYCAEVFEDILNKRGIIINGEIINIENENRPSKYNKSVKLFDWYSDSLGVVISVINKNSQNLFAELTLKTLGAEICGEGSFEASAKLIEDWLESIGITKDDVHYYDGSGLSYMNLAKPSAIIRLLQYMHDSPNFETYYESLAIPGVDRSVRDRMTDHPLADNMRTKTGYIANTRTFSGYLTTRNGLLMAFSLMVNNYSARVSEIDEWLDEVCSCVIDNY